MKAVYIDGGYSIPKNKGAWAFVVVENGQVIYTEHETCTNVKSSNSMELMALYKALRYMKRESCIIFTDCMYIEKACNVWLEQWRNNGWKRSSNKDIANKDLWKKVLEIKPYGTKVKWIKGHNGNKYNELADSLTKNY